MNIFIQIETLLQKHFGREQNFRVKRYNSLYIAYIINLSFELFVTYANTNFYKDYVSFITISASLYRVRFYSLAGW